MKKGFTLIELIMVIVVLALLALVAVPSINSVIKNSREKTYDEQINRIETVTKSYMTNSKRSVSLPSTDTSGKTNSCYVAVDILKKVGLLSLDDIKDPRKGKNNINGYVLISNSNGKFKYEYTESMTGNVPMCYDEGDVDDDTTLNVVYDCGANGGVCSSGVQKVTKRLKLSDALREAPSTPSKTGFSFDGWNTNKDAKERLRNLKSSDVKGSGKTITLYALYKKDASVRFHYYDSSSNSVSVTTSKCYIYSDNDDSCGFSTPAKVSSSTTKYGSSFVGLAIEPGSMTMVDKNNLKINTDYYALYSKKLTYYYYKDNTYVKGNLYRNEFIDNNNQMTTVVSDSESLTSNAMFNGSKGPGGSAFVGISANANVSNVITDINKVALSNMSLLYSVYRFNVLFAPGKNVSSVGTSETSCDTTYNNTTCKVSVPSVTPTSGFTFLGWSSNFNGGNEVNTSELKVSSNNQKFYAIASDQTIPSITSFVATNVTTRSITMNVSAYAASGISKYEFSMDGGVTWIDNGSNNEYTFDRLKNATDYNFRVRVTSKVGLKNTKDLSVTTKDINNPIFEETCNSGERLEVKITYPEGCGSKFICSYQATGLKGNVSGMNASVNLEGSGTLTAIVSDGVNSLSFGYNYYKKTAFDTVIKQNTTNTNNDDYRYTGSDVNNYVTFNGEIWRVIGFVDGKVKLIKATSIGTMAWSGNSNNWVKSSLNAYLNGDYYNGLSDDARDMIDKSTWYLGGASNTSLTRGKFYDLERNSSSINKNNSPSSDAYVGLMYPSDYGYAASRSECNDTILDNYDNSLCYMSDWLFNGQDEWMQSPLTDASYIYFLSSGRGYIGRKHYSYSINVRPSVYLKNDIYAIKGNGSKSSPYELEIIGEKSCGSVATIPSSNLCKRNLTYNGESQQLTSATSGIGYNLKNYNGKNAGNYTVTAKLVNGFKWSDNTTENKTFTCSIDKASSYLEVYQLTGNAIHAEQKNGIAVYSSSDTALDIVSSNTAYTLGVKAVPPGKYILSSSNTSVASISPTMLNETDSNAEAHSIIVRGGESTGVASITVRFVPRDITNYKEETVTRGVRNVKKPTFSEDKKGEVVITYPDGCGSLFRCSYIKDNNSKVDVTGTSAKVIFNASGNVVAEISSLANANNYINSSYTVEGDSTAPLIKFDTNGSTTWKKSQSTTVNVTDETALDTSSLKYLWNQSTTKPSKSSFKTSFTNGNKITKSSGTGNNWYLWILAKDKAGNTAIVRSRAFYIDNTPPTITANNNSNSNWVKYGTGVVISGKISDANSGINKSTLYYSYNGSTQKGNDWDTNNGSSYSGTWSASREQRVWVRVADKAGNYSSWASAGWVRILSAYKSGTLYGSVVGPGPSYFRTVYQYKEIDKNASQVHLQWRCYVEVTSGNFGGTILDNNWKGQFSIYGTGTYGDSGWCDYANTWVSYGSTKSDNCSANYTDYSGNYHSSTASLNFTPSRTG